MRMHLNIEDIENKNKKLLELKKKVDNYEHERTKNKKLKEMSAKLEIKSKELILFFVSILVYFVLQNVNM